MASTVSQLQDLIRKVAAYVETYMNNFDGSHDFDHIKRVLGLSHQLLSEITDAASAGEKTPKADRTVVTLSALLHDVGDRKYLKEGENGTTLVRDLLLGFGADRELADKVQAICLGVAYSSEIKDRLHVERLIEKYPELAVVQDADRLDAIGAVGVGRVFTYGAAKIDRGMSESMDILEIKLFKLEGMMKTEPGRRLARERTERLRMFREWWDEEVKAGEFFLEREMTMDNLLAVSNRERREQD